MIALRFEEIRPSEFDDQFYRKDLVFAQLNFGNAVVAEYKKVVKFWHSNTPVFTVHSSTIAGDRDKISVEVSTDNPVFYYVDRGVSSHVIIPRKARVSGTYGTYRAGSTPGTLSTNSGGGIKPGGDNRYLNLNWPVPWPGIQARGWSELIRAKMTPEFSVRMQEALNKSTANAWKGGGKGGE